MPLSRFFRLLSSFTRRRRDVASDFLTTAAAGLDHGVGDHFILRLRRWPTIVEVQRTAKRYRLLSLMSVQPVNRRWLEKHCKMRTRELDKFIAELTSCGAVEVINPASFSR